MQIFLNILQIFLNILQIFLNILQIFLYILEIFVKILQVFLNILQIFLNSFQIFLNILQIFLNIAALFYHKYQNTIELFVCFFRNSTITLLKADTSRTSDKAIVLQSCILDILPRHRNTWQTKFKSFDECAARCVYLPPQEEESTSSSKGVSKINTSCAITNWQEIIEINKNGAIAEVTILVEKFVL